MGRVDAFQLAGLSLWFNANEHEPPHFHAERPGEWELRVFFLAPEEEMFEVVYAIGRRGPPSGTKRRISRMVATHRIDLIAEWTVKTGRR